MIAAEAGIIRSRRSFHEELLSEVENNVSDYSEEACLEKTSFLHEKKVLGEKILGPVTKKNRSAKKMWGM